MPSKDHTHHQAKILVCDDDQNVRLLTRQCLEADNMIVVEAADGLQAIDVFVRERPDLVFLDVEMPGMTGLEVCQRIRQMPQGESIPIMIVTGSDDRQSIDQGFEAGATQYKTKPVNWSLLGRDVQYMLRASNAFNSLKRQEDRLRYLAYYDPLTNLPNRRSFNEQLNRILKRAHQEATRVELPPEMVLAVIDIESAFDPYAVSSAGAQGLMQVMPFWLEEIGREGDRLINIETNLRMGCTILKYYFDMEQGDWTRALARYNGSLGSRKYPEKVLNRLRSRWFQQ